MRDPHQAVQKVRAAAEAAAFTVTMSEGDRSVRLQLIRDDQTIKVGFAVRNLATGYACFHSAEIVRGPGTEPEVCWAMRDLVALLEHHSSSARSSSESSPAGHCGEPAGDQFPPPPPGWARLDQVS